MNIKQLGTSLALIITIAGAAFAMEDRYMTVVDGHAIIKMMQKSEISRVQERIEFLMDKASDVGLTKAEQNQLDRLRLQLQILLKDHS